MQTNIPLKFSLISSIVVLALGSLSGCGKADTAQPSLSGKADRTRPASLRYPVVFAHGFNETKTSFSDLVSKLRKQGYNVYASQVDAYNTPEARGKQLYQQIKLLIKKYGKVHIVAHSMGGLDARYITAPQGLNVGHQIASVTTIGTPHDGTEVADYLQNVTSSVVEKILNALLFDTERAKGDSKVHLGGALRALETDSYFNDTYSLTASVYYQSWAGVAVPGWQSAARVLKIARPYCTNVKDNTFWDGALRNANDIGKMPSEMSVVSRIAATGKLLPLYPNLGKIVSIPTDGLVSAGSALGFVDIREKHEDTLSFDFRGCIPVDHVSMIGWANPFRLRFYKHILDDLLDRVEPRLAAGIGARSPGNVGDY